MKEVLFFTVQLENCLRDYCDLTGFTQRALSQDSDFALRLKNQLSVFLLSHPAFTWAGFALKLH